MTYKELYDKALWDLEHDKITLGEFEKMIEPLNKEIPKEIPTESEEEEMSIEEKIKTAKEDSWLKDSVGEKEFKEIKDNERRMTNEEAIKKLQRHKAEYLDKWVDFSSIAEALDMAIQSLEQTDTDLISRQAVIDGLARIAKAKAKSDAQKALMGRSMYFVEKLPSAEKTAKWIFIQGYGTNHKSHYRCSNCDYKIGQFDIIFDYNFCPRCGAKMEKSDEEE